MPEKEEPVRLLIVGLGNVLMGDDGVGVHAVRALLEEPIAGVTAVEVGTAVFDALHLFEECDVVLALDAIQAGEEPGAVYQLVPDDAAARAPGSSMHELGVRDALAMLPSEKRPRLVVLGVEPHTIACGMELSARIEAILPAFLETVREVAASLRSRP